jgi:hypothetical protein
MCRSVVARTIGPIDSVLRQTNREIEIRLIHVANIPVPNFLAERFARLAIDARQTQNQPRKPPPPRIFSPAEDVRVTVNDG